MSAKNLWQERRILITGGAGFVGSNLAVALAKHGAKIVILDNLAADGGGSLSNLADLDMRLVRGDVGDRTLVERLVAEAEVIFHCAARTSHADSMADPLGTVGANVLGTLELLEACRKATETPVLLHTGTTSQTGPTAGKPVTASTAERPTDIYSASKSAAEKMVHVYREAHGLPACSVRLSNLYGPRARFDTPRLGFLHYFIGQAARGHPITVYGDGSQRRNVTYIEDAVSALLRAALHPSKVLTGLVVGSPEHLTLLQIAHAIIDVFGTGTIDHVPWPSDRARIEIGDVWVDPAPAHEALGWRAMVPFTEGLTRTAQFIQTARNKEVFA